jgi:hypothetical protein
MLAALSRVHVQLGDAGKKVARFSSHTEAAEQFDVKPHPDLEDSGCGPGFAGVGPPNSSVEFSLKYPNPPPALTQGEIPLLGKGLARIQGVTKNDL